MYRACAARANYLSQDRADIQFATKEISRKMSEPTRADWEKLKRLGRYLKGAPRATNTFAYRDEKPEIEIWTDTDFAGCPRTRKSTSGGVLRFGGSTIKTWSTTQGVIAMSSGEAKFYGMVRGVQWVSG